MLAVLYGKERNSINKVVAELINDGGDLTKALHSKIYGSALCKTTLYWKFRIICLQELSLTTIHLLNFGIQMHG